MNSVNSDSDNVRNNTWSTPYKFNGKELDEETGLAYYHARYYDPRTSVWLSVDPLKGKALNVSAYVYCYNNPVRYIDPDGRYSTEKGANISRWFYNLFHKNDAGPVFENLKGQYGYEITGINESGEFQKGYAYGRNGYNGKPSINRINRQIAGDVFFGLGRDQGIVWPEADKVTGVYDASGFLYPFSNPDSKAKLIFDAAKKAKFIMEYDFETAFKAGVEMDLPEMEEIESPKVIISYFTNEIVWTTTFPGGQSGYYINKKDTVNESEVDSVISSKRRQGMSNFNVKNIRGSGFDKYSK